MEEKRISRNLIVTTNKLKRLLDKRYKKNGLYVGQARLLSYLYRNKDSTIFQKDIENTFEIRGGTVTGLIDSLVSLNYIKRVESEIDKRKRKILLTAEGEEQAGKCIDIINNIESMLANELTADEKEVFNTIMDKINIILDEEESKWENYLNTLKQLKRN